MLEISQSILISLGTSIIVGFFTFAFGMKSGKNQTDRAKVQKIYTKLLNEFEAINDSLDARPKVWDDYPQKHRLHEIVAVTPLREIRQTGEYVYIAERQFQQLEELERDALAYGWGALRLVGSIPAILNGNPSLFEMPGEYRDGGNSGKPNVYTMKSDKRYSSFRYSSIYAFLDEQELTRQLKDETALVFNDGRSPAHVSITIIPDLLRASPSEFAHAVHEELIAKREGNTLFSRKTELAKRLNEQVELLRKRARDPFPFWRTFGAALRDIWRTD